MSQRWAMALASFSELMPSSHDLPCAETAGRTRARRRRRREAGSERMRVDRDIRVSIVVVVAGMEAGEGPCGNGTDGAPDEIERTTRWEKTQTELQVMELLNGTAPRTSPNGQRKQPPTAGENARSGSKDGKPWRSKPDEL